MSRWIEKEEKGLIEMKKLLKDKLLTIPQFPEVVGDRRLVRFLRGNQYDAHKAVDAYNKFLKFRKDNNVDQIRQEIVYNGINNAFLFPHGKVILEVQPQIAITAKGLDRKGQPIIHETYNFNPKVFKEKISIQQYLTFLTYTLELRSLILEDLSEIREREYLEAHPLPSQRSNGYGVIVQVCNIRDLKGVGFAHIQADGRAIVAAALKLGLPNYPDFLGIGIHVNVPWIFNTAWAFIKRLLDEDIIAKISIIGTEYREILLHHISLENIPELLGGDFKLYNEPYEFNISEDSPLYYPGAPLTKEYIPNRIPSFVDNKINNNSTNVLFESAIIESEPSTKYNDNSFDSNGHSTYQQEDSKTEESTILTIISSNLLLVLLSTIILVLFTIYHTEKIVLIVFPLSIAVLYSKDV
mmetsp:Transcript_8831/g.7891  ORF Transcript_8831/g.7891 Transcript_8831/m.7891 type:complete len:411 (+) Transcript_8831:60-1292(+)